MSSTDRPPLKIHVAKAKDLPFSWYELVLRPDKFAEHLKVLLQNPEGKPPVINFLINCFYFVFSASQWSTSHRYFLGSCWNILCSNYC